PFPRPAGCFDSHLSPIALSGRYTVLGLQCARSRPGCSNVFGLFDLATGTTLDLFDAVDDSSTCASTLDDARVDSSGFAAARLTQVRPASFSDPTGIACPSPS